MFLLIRPRGFDHLQETAAAVRLVGEHGLGAFCRALLNANEFEWVN